LKRYGLGANALLGSRLPAPEESKTDVNFKRAGADSNVAQKEMI